jgi:hypothetical protein
MIAFHSFWALALLAGPAVAKFDYIGINEAGPEFGEKNIPGVLNKDVCNRWKYKENPLTVIKYVWPNETSVRVRIPQASYPQS